MSYSNPKKQLIHIVLYYLCKTCFIKHLFLFQEYLNYQIGLSSFQDHGKHASKSSSCHTHQGFVLLITIDCLLSKTALIGHHFTLCSERISYCKEMSVAEISAYGMTSVAHANLCIEIMAVDQPCVYATIAASM